MKPPIFVYENGDLTIFASVEDAETGLEPIDVENDIYTAYDSEGRLLQLIPTSPRITMKDGEKEPTHAEELRVILFEFLLYVGLSGDWLKGASLQELVAKASEYKLDPARPSVEGLSARLKRWFDKSN